MKNTSQVHMNKLSSTFTSHDLYEHTCIQCSKYVHGCSERN